MINHNLNVDDVITLKKSVFFYTLVIRRFDESTTPTIYLSELKFFVNDVNILYENREKLDAYFANWSDKDTPLPANTEEGQSNDFNPNLFNNVIATDVEASAGNPVNAVIIKDIPLTSVNDIQANVLYNRNGGWIADNAEGLKIELYNTNDDPTLNSVLANTEPITIGVRIYRFDFPSIDTYSLDFSSYVSTTLIPIPSYSGSWVGTIREFASIATIPDPELNITGEVSCNSLTTSGNATVGGSLFLGDTNLTEDTDGLLTLDTNKRLTINRLTSASVKTGEKNCDYLNTTFQGKFGIPDSGNDLTLSGTQINFNSDSFISNSGGGNSGNYLVVFVNGTEYRIKLENAS
jgi:hypothetical protein